MNIAVASPAALAVLAAVASLGGCGKQHDAPQAVAASGGRVEDMVVPKGRMQGCVVKVAAAPTAITYSTTKANGDIATGTIMWKPGEALHVDGLRPVAADCGVARLTVDDALLYQDIVTVMDGLFSAGLRDVALDGAGPPLAGSGDAAPAPLPTRDAVGKAPVLIVTATTIALGSAAPFAKPDDAALEAELAGALPPKPSDPTLILQADAQTSAAAINHIVQGALKAGYTNLLFAVKSK